MVIAGCDPGADGAIVFLDVETMRVISAVDMPMSAGELRVRELCLDLLAALDERRCAHLWIERQAPFAGGTRRIGATSAFNLGRRYQAIITIAACNGWPYEIVSAAKWKSHYRIAAAKALAIHTAGQLMPEDAGWWTARRGHCTRARAIGRAEAALIGLYGIRSIQAGATALAAAAAGAAA